MQKKLGKLYILVNELLIQIVHILVSELLVNLGENSDSRFRQSTISRRKALLDIVHDLADLW